MRLIFTASNGFVGRAVRWFTGSPTSHVMIEFFCPILGANVTVDSDLRGVQLMPSFKTRVAVVAEYDCPDQMRGALSPILRHLGERYDFGGLFLMSVPILLWRWFRVRIRHPLLRTNSVKCSELVAQVLKEARMPGTQDWDPELISPFDIMKYCSMSDMFTTSRGRG